jgi:hypothetical protein
VNGVEAADPSVGFGGAVLRRDAPFDLDLAAQQVPQNTHPATLAAPCSLEARCLEGFSSDAAERKNRGAFGDTAS